MDITVLMENVLDPAHLPFTHHSTISNRSRASAVDIAPEGPVTSEGFTAKRSTTAAGGMLLFTAPNLVVGLTDRSASGSFRDWNVVYATPSRPGRCRVFVRIVFEVSKVPVPLKFVFQATFSPNVPAFLSHIINHQILEDDNIFLHEQGKRFVPNGTMSADWRERMYMPTSSDVAVVQYKRWLEKFGSSGVAWASPSQDVPTASANKAALIERLTSHTAHCSSCAGALETATSLQQVAEIVLVLGIVSAMLLDAEWRWVAALVVLVAFAVRGASRMLEAKLTVGEYPPPRNRT